MTGIIDNGSGNFSFRIGNTPQQQGIFSLFLRVKSNQQSLSTIFRQIAVSSQAALPVSPGKCGRGSRIQCCTNSCDSLFFDHGQVWNDVFTTRFMCIF
ncbi:hypothetical protein D3C87_1408810 [compost metagenome]